MGLLFNLCSLTITVEARAGSWNKPEELMNLAEFSGGKRADRDSMALGMGAGPDCPGLGHHSI